MCRTALNFPYLFLFNVMFTANFLDDLSQPDDTQNFQATAPSNNPVTRGGRL
jgi:hypothetical protein